MATYLDVRAELWNKIASHPNLWVRASFFGGHFGLLVGAIIYSIFLFSTAGTWIEEWHWNFGQKYGMYIPMVVEPIAVLLCSILVGICVTKLFYKVTKNA